MGLPTGFGGCCWVEVPDTWVDQLVVVAAVGVEVLGTWVDQLVMVAAVGVGVLGT